MKLHFCHRNQLENFQTPPNMTWKKFNLVSHDMVTLKPLTFCKPSFRLLWMKPSRCTWPSHSSIGHGINQTFIAGNSLQISACHVYQSVWQMIMPSPEQQPYLGGWACPGFLDELVLELCGQESLVRLSTPGCHWVTDWGEILSESIPPPPPPLPPPQLLERFFTKHGLL